MCKNSEPVVHGVGKGEMVDVLCDVVANPNVEGFHWAFNNSAGLIHVPTGRATTINGTRSKLTYTPRNNKDYGTLMCEAKNEVGKQKHPCIFHIILAGKQMIIIISSDAVLLLFLYLSLWSNHGCTVVLIDPFCSFLLDFFGSADKNSRRLFYDPVFY